MAEAARKTVAQIYKAHDPVRARTREFAKFLSIQPILSPQDIRKQSKLELIQKKRKHREKAKELVDQATTGYQTMLQNDQNGNSRMPSHMLSTFSKDQFKADISLKNQFFKDPNLTFTSISSKKYVQQSPSRSSEKKKSLTQTQRVSRTKFNLTSLQSDKELKAPSGLDNDNSSSPKKYAYVRSTDENIEGWQRKSTQSKDTSQTKIEPLKDQEGLEKLLLQSPDYRQALVGNSNNQMYNPENSAYYLNNVATNQEQKSTNYRFYNPKPLKIFNSRRRTVNPVNPRTIYGEQTDCGNTFTSFGKLPHDTPKPLKVNNVKQQSQVPRKKHLVQIQMTNSLSRPRNSEHLSMGHSMLNVDQFAEQVNARAGMEDPVQRKNFMFDTTSTFLPQMNVNPGHHRDHIATPDLDNQDLNKGFGGSVKNNKQAGGKMKKLPPIVAGPAGQQLRNNPNANTTIQHKTKKLHIGKRNSKNNGNFSDQELDQNADNDVGFMTMQSSFYNRGFDKVPRSFKQVQSKYPPAQVQKYVVHEQVAFNSQLPQMVLGRPNVGTLDLEQPFNPRISPKDSLRGFSLLQNKEGASTVRTSRNNSDLQGPIQAGEQVMNQIYQQQVGSKQRHLAAPNNRQESSRKLSQHEISIRDQTPFGGFIQGNNCVQIPPKPLPKEPHTPLVNEGGNSRLPDSQNPHSRKVLGQQKKDNRQQEVHTAQRMELGRASTNSSFEIPDVQ